MVTSAAAIGQNPPARPGRPQGVEGAPAGRLVLRRLCRRRHHLQIVGEELCEALDLRAGQKVLDVAAGNGNATLAAARRWCEVVSTDYVPSLLERGRMRAAAEGLSVEFREADAEALPFADASFDVVVSTFGVMFTPNQEQGRRRAPARVQARRQDRPGQLDAGGLHRPALQDARQVPAAAGRRQVAGAVGHAGAHHRDVRAAAASIKAERSAISCSATARRSTSWTSSRPTMARCSRPFAALDEAGQRGLAARSARADREDEPRRATARMVLPSEYLEIVITKR